MIVNPQRMRNMLVRAWSAVPGSRSRVWGIWLLGLSLGSAGFLATIALPATAALLLWLVMLGLGLLLVWRAEPVLSGAVPRPPEQLKTAPAPPQPIVHSRPSPIIELVNIHGGLFNMGSPPATQEEIQEYTVEWAEFYAMKPEEAEKNIKSWRQNEEPIHQVRVSSFFMARTPVTRGQWRAVIAETPDEWEKDESDQALPATHVDWVQALTFCNSLSDREGLSPCYRQEPAGSWQWDRGADGYRLPTEAEWEYACRADTGSRWFWGDKPDGADAHAWYRSNAQGRLQPVGKKAPNPWELHDMAGLVFEWCWDCFDRYPADQDLPPTDPVGPVEGDMRVVRGGSFEGPPFGLRSALRGIVEPDFRRENLGLRGVRSRVRQP